MFYDSTPRKPTNFSRGSMSNDYKASMKAAKEDGYIKYYNKMKELYDQMVEEGLYKNESDINGPSFEEIYTDLDNRVKSRGGYFHG